MSWVVELLREDGTVITRAALRGTELRIGRDLSNDLVLDDPHCAAFHAVLRTNGDSQAELQDLDTVNGIHTRHGWRKSQRHRVYQVQDDRKIRVGASTIRIRHPNWPIAPEKPLSTRRTWPAALVALALVVAHGIWNLWLTDIRDTSPTYLLDMTGLVAMLAVWSSAYAILGRIFGGPERFFTHLLIVCCAYLTLTLLDEVEELLAFSFYWLWPLRIASYVTIVVVALTIRAHLRIADPRHWSVTRWGIALGTVVAIAVPLAQTWISSHRLTNIQTVHLVKHPSLRLASPSGVDSIIGSITELKEATDALSHKDFDAEPVYSDAD